MAINFRSSTRISNLRIGPLSGGGGDGGGGGGYTTSGLVSTGLLVNVDLGDTNSYPGTGTTVSDLSGNGFDVSLSSASNQQGTGTGVYTIGSAAVATQNNQFGLYGGTYTYSYSGWYYGNNHSSGNIRKVFDENIGNLQAYTYQNQLGIQMVTQDGGVDYHFIVSAGTLSSRWWNIVVTVDQGTLTTYIDGIQQTTRSVGSTFVNETKNWSFHSGVNSRWAQTAIYSRELTASEVLSNYDALKSRYGY